MSDAVYVIFGSAIIGSLITFFGFRSRINELEKRIARLERKMGDMRDAMDGWKR